MGSGPSRKGFQGDTALRNILTTSVAKSGDQKQKGLHAVTFVEPDLVSGAGEKKILISSKTNVNIHANAIASSSSSSTKFMQQQVSWRMMIHYLIHHTMIEINRANDLNVCT